MKNSEEIRISCNQLCESSEHICSLLTDMEYLEEMDSHLLGTWRDLQLNELEHMQMLILQLTGLLTENLAEEVQNQPEHVDDDDTSAFFAGELNAKKSVPAKKPAAKKQQNDHGRG